MIRVIKYDKEINGVKWIRVTDIYLFGFILIYRFQKEVDLRLPKLD